MAKPLVSDALWERIEPLIPVEAPKPDGGRPRVPDRACLAGIVFVLRTGTFKRPPWAQRRDLTRIDRHAVASRTMATSSRVVAISAIEGRRKRQGTPNAAGRSRSHVLRR
jgi:hypothetical protein